MPQATSERDQALLSSRLIQPPAPASVLASRPKRSWYSPSTKARLPWGSLGVAAVWIKIGAELRKGTPVIVGPDWPASAVTLTWVGPVSAKSLRPTSRTV